MESFEIRSHLLKTVRKVAKDAADDAVLWENNRDVCDDFKVAMRPTDDAEREKKTQAFLRKRYYVLIDELLKKIEDEITEAVAEEWMTRIFEEVDPSRYQLNSIRDRVNKLLLEIEKDKGDATVAQRMAALNHIIKSIEVTDDNRVQIRVYDYAKVYPEDCGDKLLEKMHRQSDIMEAMITGGKLRSQDVTAIEGQVDETINV